MLLCTLELQQHEIAETSASATATVGNTYKWLHNIELITTVINNSTPWHWKMLRWGIIEIKLFHPSIEPNVRTIKYSFVLFSNFIDLLYLYGNFKFYWWYIRIFKKLHETLRNIKVYSLVFNFTLWTNLNIIKMKLKVLSDKTLFIGFPLEIATTVTIKIYLKKKT